MAGYTIGSEKGKQIANSMKAGETYKASDGSTWTKNSDGTVSVTTKNGGYTANALAGAGGSGTSSSAGSSSSGGYVAKGTHNDSSMNASDYAKIQDYKNQWQSAYEAGDKDSMAAAHAAAEALRAQYNYSGGGDGSEYLEIPLEERFQVPVYSFDEEVRPTYSDVTSNVEVRHEEVPEYTFEEENTRPDEYVSQYDPQIDELLNAILTRDDFSYDVNSDPLYAQYKQQYLREGNRAMNDTLASAAANAGGMNSYAVTAAQQANNYYTSQLGDKIPELYQLAYSMYLDDKASDVENLGILQSMDNTQYSRYRDTMSDWYNDRNFAYGQYRDDMGDWESDRNFAYGQYRDAISDWENDRNFAYQQYRDAMGDYTNNRDYQYGVSRDEIEDDRYNTEWEYTTSVNDKETAYNQALDFMAMGIMPSADLLAKAGISTTEAQTYVNRVIAEMNKVGSSGGGGGSKKSSGSGSKKTTGSAQEDFTPLNSVDQLGAAAQKQVKSLSMMKDSMSNMQKDTEGMYPVEKSILLLVGDGIITDQEAEYMLRYFGYDSSKHYG